MERRWQRRASIWLQTLVLYSYALLQLQVPPCSATTPDNNVDSDNTASRDAGCRVFEGDICVNDMQWEYLNHMPKSIPSPLELGSDEAGSLAPRRVQRAVVKLELLKWANGLVPYTLDDNLSTAAVNSIQAAMNQFTLDTCIRFIPKNVLHYDYVHFFSGNGCYSSIGRRGGKQDISIGPTCASKGVVMHEIFHALGRWHEQSRPDRDRYIVINSQNIKPKYARNFQSIDENMSTTNDIPYDYDSIMHYDAYAFSRNDQPTIRPLDNTVILERLGQRTRLSEKDLNHIRELYCQDQMPTNVWSRWSTWGECSSTCGGGKQVRTRTCIGGDQCPGTSSASRDCNTDPCPTIASAPSWGVWSEWSGCSRTCGGGKRLRLRSCQGSPGDDCNGNSTEYEACNTRDCPSKWAEWSGWSDCSKSCDGGVRYRSRNCLPDLHCSGEAKEKEPCNVNVTCYDDLEWSECSRECGGGIQWRLNSSSGEIVRRSCNEQACHNEVCLKGVKYIGCYKMSHSRLKMYENMTKELSDSPIKRTEPVRKCGTAALDHGNMYFSLGEGMCFSGSNQISDYTEGGESRLCIDGRGSSTDAGQSAIDVYHIDDMTAFQDSSVACATLGKDFCSEQRSWISSSLHTLPSVSVIHLLFLVSVFYTCAVL